MKDATFAPNYSACVHRRDRRGPRVLRVPGAARSSSPIFGSWSKKRRRAIASTRRTSPRHRWPPMAASSPRTRSCCRRACCFAAISSSGPRHEHSRRRAASRCGSRPRSIRIAGGCRLRVIVMPDVPWIDRHDDTVRERGARPRSTPRGATPTAISRPTRAASRSIGSRTRTAARAPRGSRARFRRKPIGGRLLGESRGRAIARHAAAEPHPRLAAVDRAVGGTSCRRRRARVRAARDAHAERQARCASISATTAPAPDPGRGNLPAHVGRRARRGPCRRHRACGCRRPSRGHRGALRGRARRRRIPHRCSLRIAMRDCSRS